MLQHIKFSKKAGSNCKKNTFLAMKPQNIIGHGYLEAESEVPEPENQYFHIQQLRSRLKNRD